MRLKAVHVRAVQAGSAVQPDGRCIPAPFIRIYSAPRKPAFTDWSAVVLPHFMGG